MAVLFNIFRRQALTDDSWRLHKNMNCAFPLILKIILTACPCKLRNIIIKLRKTDKFSQNIFRKQTCWNIKSKSCIVYIWQVKLKIKKKIFLRISQIFFWMVMWCTEAALFNICVSRGKKCQFLENFAYVLNGWLLSKFTVKMRYDFYLFASIKYKIPKNWWKILISFLYFYLG